MRDLLSLLDNVLSEKAVIAAPDRFVSAKSMPSPIKNFIQSKVGPLDDIFIDRVQPSRNLFDIRQKSSFNDAAYYQRYMIGDRKAVTDLKKYLRQINKPPVSDPDTNKFRLKEPKNGSTVGPSSKPDSDGSQQGDNDSQSGPSVAKPRIPLKVPSTINRPVPDIGKVPTLKLSLIHISEPTRPY